MKFGERREIKLPTHCHDIAVSGDGKIYAACFDGGIYMLRPGALLKDYEKIAQHDNYASGIHWSEVAKQLVSAGYDGRLKWIDPGEKKELRSVKAHDFWSWQSAISPDGAKVASSTGQYLCGGYKYEPAPEREPSVKVYGVASGDLLHALPHIPPVESVAFSNDGRLLAAGNLMGEVRVWDLAGGAKEIARWTTPDFTGWGIIKGHYYTGGIFSLTFAPGDSAIYLAGMGSTRDPAAGNGKQLWQKYTWDGPDGPERVAAASDGEIGQGLMETLAFHPEGKQFVMAGRLFKGDWNTAIFDTRSGNRIAHQNTGVRTSAAAFSADGKTLYLAGGKGQSKDLKNPKDWGRVFAFDILDYVS